MSDETFQIEVDTKKVKFNPFVDGQIRDGIKKSLNVVNAYDGLIPNGNPDIDDIHDVVVALLPELVSGLTAAAKLSEAIDFDDMAADLVDAPWVKDKTKMVSIVTELAHFVEKSGQIVEKIAPIVLVQVQAATEEITKG